MLRCALVSASIGLALGGRDALLAEVDAQFSSMNQDIQALKTQGPQVKSMAFMSTRQADGFAGAAPPSFENLEVERNFLEDVKGTMRSNSNIFIENTLVTKQVQVSELNNFFAQQTEVVQQLERYQESTQTDGYGNAVTITRKDLAKAMFKYSVEVITAGCQDVSLFVASKQEKRANFYRQVSGGVTGNGRDAYAYTCVTEGASFEAQMVKQLNFAHLDTNAPIVKQCINAQVKVSVQVFIKVETQLCVYTPVNPIYPTPQPPILPPVFPPMPPVFPPMPPVFPPQCYRDTDCVSINGQAFCNNGICETRPIQPQCQRDADCISINGQAICKNGVCQMRPNCPQNMRWNHNKHECVCKNGYRWNNRRNKCVRKNKRCGKHQRWNGQKCVCKNGYRWNNRERRCVRKNRRCGKNERWSRNQLRCVCKRGYFRNQRGNCRRM